MLSEILAERRKKLDIIRNAKIDPYPCPRKAELFRRPCA